jgi:hypothetical protein
MVRFSNIKYEYDVMKRGSHNFRNTCSPTCLNVSDKDRLCGEMPLDCPPRSLMFSFNY